MSTPSTATATIPSHHPHHSHPHYGYSNHAAYQANAGLHGPSDVNSLGPSRLGPSYNSYSNLSTVSHRNSATSSTQAPSYTAMVASQPTPALHQQAVKRERRPDWHEFYKNGMPKEIIVIDDDSPVPPSRRDDRPRPAVTNNNVAEPASKKRKTGAHDPVPVRYQPSYSNTNTPHYPSNTASTDRTTSLQTTAPTSLGSHGSGGSGGTYVDSAVGQKRKRVTRQQTNEEKKRKEIEVNGDAYSFYVPPPNPPIKAGDVQVKMVQDVSRLNVTTMSGHVADK